MIRIKFMQIKIIFICFFCRTLLKKYPFIVRMFIFNKEIVRKIFSRSIVKIVTILSLTSLVQAAQFHLPIGTPGLQGGLVRQNVNGHLVNCERVIVPGTNCHLYFPIDGSQPTTAEAGQYSGARFVGQHNDDLVTDWWVRVFGGNDAVNLSYLIPHVDIENDVFMGFNYLYGLNVNPYYNITSCRQS